MAKAGDKRTPGKPARRISAATGTAVGSSAASAVGTSIVSARGIARSKASLLAEQLQQIQEVLKLLSPAAAPAVDKLPGKKWVTAQQAHDLRHMNITQASVVLAETSKTAPDCARPLTPRYVERLLRDFNVFPKKPR